MRIEELKHKDIWTGQYRGIRFEIVKWFIGVETSTYPIWNYYLLIPLKQVPEELCKEFNLKPHKSKLVRRISYNYFSAIFSNWEWHGGVTYYEKIGREIKELAFKIGCDYNHLWDAEAGYPYDVDYVFREVKETINSAREHISGLKWWCLYTGDYYDESEGTIDDKGNFLSFEGQKMRAESVKKYEKERVN